MTTAAQALRDLADMFDKRRPSAVQTDVGRIEFNDGAVKSLVWAAQQARELADKLDKE